MSLSPYFQVHFTILIQGLTIESLGITSGLLSPSLSPYVINLTYRWLSCFYKIVKLFVNLLLKTFTGSLSPLDKNKNCFSQIFMAFHILFTCSFLSIWQKLPIHPSKYNSIILWYPFLTSIIHQAESMSFSSEVS